MARLEAWLVDDPDGSDWIAQMKDATPASVSVEIDRRFLTNDVLKPFMKTEAGLAAFPFGGRAGLERLVRVTIPLDRINAVRYMSLDRDNPDAPRGFLWVTDAALQALPSKPFLTTAEGHRNEQTFSVAKAYVNILAATASDEDTAFHDYLDDMTKTMEPEWMNGLKFF